MNKDFYSELAEAINAEIESYSVDNTNDVDDVLEYDMSDEKKNESLTYRDSIYDSQLSKTFDKKALRKINYKKCVLLRYDNDMSKFVIDEDNNITHPLWMGTWICGGNSKREALQMIKRFIEAYKTDISMRNLDFIKISSKVDRYDDTLFLEDVC